MKPLIPTVLVNRLPSGTSSHSCRPSRRADGQSNRPSDRPTNLSRAEGSMESISFKRVNGDCCAVDGDYSD